MRVRVEVERLQKDRWEMRYPGLRPKGPPVPVELVSAGTITLAKTAGFDPATPADRDLALAVTALKTPKAGEVARFGGYLFDVLLGAVWAEVEALAEADPLETIELSSSDPEFHRLPWEMARNAAGFLAKQGVGFVRLVPSAAAAQTVTIAPRVLFVVGSDLNDKRVKAGAEYLGVMKRLEATALVMETHVVVRATRKSIEETVQRLRPSIVVFICHGSIGADGKGQLELTPEDRSQKTDYLSGKQLRDLLHGIPQAVVMNACETGASSRSSIPLAWEIVSEEIPLAIGMTGRVADRACRLFSRRFFEALLKGEPLHAATAVARQEGMLHGSDPELSVDWAMPALFMLDGVTVEVDEDAVAAMKERARRSKLFRKISNPLVVCGRLDCIGEYSRVVGTPADLPAPRTLALRVTEKYEGDYTAKYGKTRSLEELAAIGALWGHIPCLVRKPSATLWGLCRDIVTSMVETRQAFGLGDADSELFKLEDYLASGVGELTATVKAQLRLRGQQPPLTMDEAHPKVLLAALQADLAVLAADAAKVKGTAEKPRVLVFLDDLHFCPAAEQLVTEWVTANGLGRGGGPEPQIVPLIFTYSSVDKEIYRQVAAALRTVAESQTTQISSVDLKSLPSPLDDELPYRQFLLSQSPMLVPADDNPPFRDAFFKGLHDYVMGLPSRLETRRENESVGAWVKSAKEFKILVEADDDKLAAQAGNAGDPNGDR